MGPSVFTENSRRHVMLEVNSPEDGSSSLSEDEGYKRALIESYYAAVSTILVLLYARKGLGSSSGIGALSCLHREKIPSISQHYNPTVVVASIMFTYLHS